MNQKTTVEAKKRIAKEIVIEHVKDNYQKDTWVYIDYVLEGCFDKEIENDKDIDWEKWDGEGIADYITETLDRNYGRSILLHAAY